MIAEVDSVELRKLKAVERAWDRLKAECEAAPPLTATTAYSVVVKMRELLREELARIDDQ